MRLSPIFSFAGLLAGGLILAAPALPVQAQARKSPAAAKSKKVQPERSLVGIRLGRSFQDVIRLYKNPDQMQTVALAQPSDNLPGLGGAGAGADMMGYGAGAMGSGGPMAAGMMGGGGAFGGGSPFGGGGAMGLPGPADGGADLGSGGMMGYGGMMGAPGGDAMMGYGGMMGSGGMMGAPGGDAMMGYGGEMGGASGMMGGLPGSGGPEYSNAILFIYNRPNNVRLEFLINEDGRVAQISAAAPAGKGYPSARTARGIRLGSTLSSVMSSYGSPERYRMVPGGRFYELYYTKSHHAAFTFDTTKNMKVVRITIALAD